MPKKYTGLTSKEAEIFIKQNGQNVLPEEKKNFFQTLAREIFSPSSLMLLAAAALSAFVGKYIDAYIILVLFCSNFAIGIWHKKKADKSINELQKSLTLDVRVFRDDEWQTIDSINLVLGDILELKIGAVVPADISILDAKNLSINESVLTGESLPKQKEAGDTAYSGSFVTTGNGIGKVSATGGHTYFGKTIAAVDATPRQSSLEKDILSISKFISIISIIVVFILSIVLYATHAKVIDIVTLDLSLLIAGIPVALPTVMSLIISIGVLSLAKKQVVVRRLASLEDLANVDLLLSDKTGTLTQNEIKVEKIMAFDHYTEKEVVNIALSAISDPYNNPLDRAISQKSEAWSLKPYPQIDLIPGDSERKRSTATVLFEENKSVISLGAPQVIESLCQMTDASKTLFEDSVHIAASEGYRALAVAINKHGMEEKSMKMVGILFLADHLHEDAASTIQFMNESGIAVKMVTGDSFEISARVAEELGLKGEICRREVLDGSKDVLRSRMDSIAAFAEVLPKDKYDIVTLAQEHHIVAATGDGVNDLPAIKKADVGFAVSNSVSALKSSADIVLLKNGISVIKDAIIESRKIFTRLYNYSVYRISESFRVIITIAVIGLIYKTYPLTPIQLIVLAFLNDVPIVSLAFDRVKASIKPAHIDAKKRFALSVLFGLTGTMNSLLLLLIMTHVLYLPWEMIQTVFFLKLTVSGHMLVYVAHTKEKWFRYLPSKPVIYATIGTQLIATILALTGTLTAPISLPLILMVWVWSFFWMQVSELMKSIKSLRG